MNAFAWGHTVAPVLPQATLDGGMHVWGVEACMLTTVVSWMREVGLGQRVELDWGTLWPVS